MVGGEGEGGGPGRRLHWLLGLDNVVVGLSCVTQDAAPVITRGERVRADMVTRGLETGDLQHGDQLSMDTDDQ